MSHQTITVTGTFATACSADQAAAGMTWKVHQCVDTDTRSNLMARGKLDEHGFFECSLPLSLPWTYYRVTLWEKYQPQRRWWQIIKPDMKERACFSYWFVLDPLFAEGTGTVDLKEIHTFSLSSPKGVDNLADT